MKVDGRGDDEGALLRLLEELDRCEDLLDEMAELGVESRADIHERMSDLNARIDALGGE